MAICIKIQNVYMTHIFKLKLIDLWLNQLNIFYWTLTIIQNLNIKLFIIVDWLLNFYFYIYNTYILIIISFFCNEFNFSWDINQIINYIFLLFFYIKIKLYIKYLLFLKLIIKILKTKINSKFLTLYKKIPTCLMQISSTILNYNKKRSIFKYFLLITIFFLSYMSPFPLGPDHNYLSIIIFALIRYELKNFIYSISILSVIPLAYSDEDDNTNLESEEEKNRNY